MEQKPQGKRKISRANWLAFVGVVLAAVISVAWADFWEWSREGETAPVTVTLVSWEILKDCEIPSGKGGDFYFKVTVGGKALIEVPRKGRYNNVTDGKVLEIGSKKPLDLPTKGPVEVTASLWNANTSETDEKDNELVFSKTLPNAQAGFQAIPAVNGTSDCNAVLNLQFGPTE